MDKKVILIHGYSKTKKDMLVLKKNLEKLGYECFLANLPLTFKEIEFGTDVFKRELEKLIIDLTEDEKINLVGHSTGGLVIRTFLSNTNLINRIGRCVLISTPNNGSKLADITDKIPFRILANIFKTLKSLQTNNVKNMKLKNIENIDIGAIAGNKSNLFLGRFLKGENDGRIEVNSVIYDGLKDIIMLPYGHKEIHYKLETARLVDKFLKTGKFK
ncbi:alpha/beta fold hydrolase [Tepidibacter formicigenes]|jgi:triacylglycerol esterase/lipase EstA (alpha/beta hydrolase family)|uniref:Alpha/beta hydrolase family protein n=1 Tax=Tepidibacter formicigenes DSM 15518 TaxID=1123349 RepID=A0A1M6J7J2_9FIRM|nr:alpha/beta fold hydrolase [Tepidibacter formicigenes]SHJ42631.1 Alpha/beta hydrolase family protein [Tepidibacter formicigenes DSM 15518]